MHGGHKSDAFKKGRNEFDATEDKKLPVIK